MEPALEGGHHFVQPRLRRHDARSLPLGGARDVIHVVRPADRILAHLPARRQRFRLLLALVVVVLRMVHRKLLLRVRHHRPVRRDGRAGDGRPGAGVHRRPGDGLLAGLRLALGQVRDGRIVVAHDRVVEHERTAHLRDEAQAERTLRTQRVRLRDEHAALALVRQIDQRQIDQPHEAVAPCDDQQRSDETICLRNQ
uniref:Uncharacterized protein n=1 Tax=Anopheles atroparvus TaxID=41427 RepID=A0A182J579_ANOAO